MTTIEVLCAAILATGIGGSEKWGNYACELLPDITAAATANGLDPELIIAVIHHESRFRPHVVSHAGACGLMQVLPKYTGNKRGGVNKSTGVPKLTCDQLKEPKTAVKYGTMTLRYWIKRYGRDNKRVGLCGYNAGFRCKGKSPHPKGTYYAKAVLRTTKKIKRKVHKLNSSR